MIPKDIPDIMNRKSVMNSIIGDGGYFIRFTSSVYNMYLSAFVNLSDDKLLITQHKAFYCGIPQVNG